MQVAHIQKEIFLLIQTRKTEEKKNENTRKTRKTKFLWIMQISDSSFQMENV